MRATALLLALCAAGCYSPNVPDGRYTCASNSSCPDNLSCNACGVCVQSSEPLDAQASCPADMTVSNSCAQAVACDVTCQGAKGALQGCFNGCAMLATPSDKATYLDPLFNCVMTACNCPGGDLCTGGCFHLAISQPDGKCATFYMNCVTAP